MNSAAHMSDGIDSSKDGRCVNAPGAKPFSESTTKRQQLVKQTVEGSFVRTQKTRKQFPTSIHQNQNSNQYVSLREDIEAMLGLSTITRARKLTTLLDQVMVATKI